MTVTKDLMANLLLAAAIEVVSVQVVAATMVNLPTGMAQRKRLVVVSDNPIENVKRINIV